MIRGFKDVCEQRCLEKFGKAAFLWVFGSGSVGLVSWVCWGVHLRLLWFWLCYSGASGRVEKICGVHCWHPCDWDLRWGNFFCYLWKYLMTNFFHFPQEYIAHICSQIFHRGCSSIVQATYLTEVLIIFHWSINFSLRCFSLRKHKNARFADYKQNEECMSSYWNHDYRIGCFGKSEHTLKL